MRKVFRILDRYWFTPGSLRDLALMRIVLGSSQLFFLLWPTVTGACSGCGIDYQLYLTKADPSLYVPLPALKVMLSPFGWGVRPDAMFLQLIWLGAVFAGAGTILGLHTKVS